MIRVISLVIVLSVILGGCAGTLPSPTKSDSAVCDALVGPIKYNSKNPKSSRYAAKNLAPDLAVRNRVGINLQCPKYR